MSARPHPWGLQSPATISPFYRDRVCLPLAQPFSREHAHILHNRKLTPTRIFRSPPRNSPRHAILCILTKRAWLWGGISSSAPFSFTVFCGWLLPSHPLAGKPDTFCHLLFPWDRGQPALHAVERLLKPDYRPSPTLPQAHHFFFLFAPEWTRAGAGKGT